MRQKMDFKVIVLIIIHLPQVLQSMVPTRERNWLECINEKNTVFGNPLFHTRNTPLVQCLSLCLMTDQCGYVSSLADTRECKGYTNLTSSTPTNGARLWGSNQCPHAYISSGGLCFHFSTTRISWDGAHAQCEASGSHLLILDSQKKFDAFNIFMNTYSNKQLYYWVGATDEGDKDWTWLNGAPVNRSLFGLTEAEYDYIYDYVGIVNGGVLGYALDASGNFNRFPFICEHDMCPIS